MKGNRHMKKITKFIYAAFASVVLAIGAVTANGAPADLFASINGTGGNGAGSINQYRTSGVFRPFVSGLCLPRGVAFGTGGSLFVATNTCDETCQVSIVKITPEGVQSTVATLSGDLFA